MKGYNVRAVGHVFCFHYSFVSFLKTRSGSMLIFMSAVIVSLYLAPMGFSCSAKVQRPNGFKVYDLPAECSLRLLVL